MNIRVPSLAALLGVRPKKTKDFDLFDLADEIGKGLPVEALSRICALVAPDDASFRYRIVPKATLARRQRNARRLTRDESDRLVRLARIWAFAMDLWKSEPAAQRFLAKPHPLLAGRVPREFTLESEIGAREVEELIGRAKYGIPT